jgi:hypothetical protein
MHQDICRHVRLPGRDDHLCHRAVDVRICPASNGKIPRRWMLASLQISGVAFSSELSSVANIEYSFKITLTLRSVGSTVKGCVAASEFQSREVDWQLHAGHDSRASEAKKATTSDTSLGRISSFGMQARRCRVRRCRSRLLRGGSRGSALSPARRW